MIYFLLLDPTEDVFENIMKVNVVKNNTGSHLAFVEWINICGIE